MRLFASFIFCLLLCHSSFAQDDLKQFFSRVKSAKSYGCHYKSGDVEGKVVIAADEMYLSQQDKLEIYEKGNVRYSYNVKRRKVDIDAIKREESAAATLFNWLGHTDDYKVLSKVKDSSGNSVYTISGNHETIDVAFNGKGALVFIVYDSEQIRRLRVEIDDFKINAELPSEFFTFNPSVRKDLEVTDYR